MAQSTVLHRRFSTPPVGTVLSAVTTRGNTFLGEKNLRHPATRQRAIGQWGRPLRGMCVSQKVALSTLSLLLCRFTTSLGSTSHRSTIVARLVAMIVTTTIVHFGSMMLSLMTDCMELEWLPLRLAYRDRWDRLRFVPSNFLHLLLGPVSMPCLCDVFGGLPSLLFVLLVEEWRGSRTPRRLLW